MKNLTIAIPSKLHINASTVTSIMTSCLRNIGEYAVNVSLLTGKSNIIHARSILLTRWYDQSTSDDDLFLFLDSDQTFNKLDIEALINLNSDVACGVYVNSQGSPNCYPEDHISFYSMDSTNRNINLLYGATGFMLIRKPVLHKIIQYLKDKQYSSSSGDIRFWISSQENNIIPFFRTQIIESELNPGTQKEWLGEDYSFCWLVRQVGGTIKGYLSTTIGHEVSQIKYYEPGSEDQKLIPRMTSNNEEERKKINIDNSSNRKKINSSNDRISNGKYYIPDQSIPENLKQKMIDSLQLSTQSNHHKWKENTVVYYTGISKVLWSPNTSGLGGSEKAVVNLTRYWAQNGYEVYVYGNVIPGIYEKVKYFKYNEFEIKDYYYNLILWRGFGLQILPICQSVRIFVDLHDNTDKRMFNYFNNITNKITRCMFKSMMHRNLFKSVIPDHITAVIPNGVETEHFDSIHPIPERNPFRLIYTSSYDRGLLHMLKFGWPIIKSYVPQAEFHIYYGMELVPEEYRKELEPFLQQNGIFDHGRQSHEVICQAFLESNIHYYLTTCPVTEIDCISVKESAYAGCIPVLSTLAVFNERIGIHIDGDPTTPEMQEHAAKIIIKLLTDAQQCEDIRNKLKPMIRAQTPTWEEIGHIWTNFFPMLN